VNVRLSVENCVCEYPCSIQLKRRSRFSHESESVRYWETEEAKRLNCWSPSTSVKVTWVPPNRSPPLVTPRATGGRPSRNIFSKRPFFFALSCTSEWVSGAWKSMIGPGAPKSSEATVLISSFRSRMWRP
jgi:hypothetical protein